MVYDNRLELREHDPFKTVEPDRLHLSVLRAFAGVLARSLPIIFEKLWKSMEVLDNWKKRMLYPLQRMPRSADQSASQKLTRKPWNLLKNASGHKGEGG